MKIVQGIKSKGNDWQLTKNIKLKSPLVLVFGNRLLIENTVIYDELRSFFPDGQIVFGSSSGEIIKNTVEDNSVVFTAIELEKSSFKIETVNIFNHNKNCRDAGIKLAKKFNKSNLKHLFVISEGSFVNGSRLIAGIETVIGKTPIAMTGGLCSDGNRFLKTVTSYNETPLEGEIVAIGFYGETLEISYANYGGWQPFGPERIVTHSKGNILYEIDGTSALSIYKKYLGKKAKQLPQSALYYPLKVTETGSKWSIIRAIINIDDKQDCMILAGDVPQGSKVQLLLSSADDIVTGANKAASLAMRGRIHKPELAILVSSLGRKLVLDQRVEEEVEEVQYIIGNETTICGFYSYGEMAPYTIDKRCKLHNQTMTLTLISE